MTPTQITVLAILGGLGLLMAGRWLLRLGRRRAEGDAFLGLMKLVVSPLVRGYWGARFTGFERIPTPPPGRGLILVCNHTSGLDPVLITWKSPLRIRWLMSRAMMVKALGFLWRRLGILPIDFGARTARRSPTRGDPQGWRGVDLPRGSDRTPTAGRSAVSARRGPDGRQDPATVVLMHSHDPPRANDLRVLTPWRAMVDVVDVIDYDDRSLKAKAITADLRQRLHEASGWPMESISVEEARQRD